MHARDQVESAIRRELFGPPDGATAVGKPLDLVGLLQFESFEKARGPWHCAVTQQEVLSEVEPVRRYGLGLLFPRSQLKDEREHQDEKLTGVTGIPVDDEIRDAPMESPNVRKAIRDLDSDDFELRGANSFQPSAMAVSFRARIVGDIAFTVGVSGATYEKLPVRIANSERTWWVRRPFGAGAGLQGERLLAGTGKPFKANVILDNKSNASPLVEIVSRADPTCDDSATRLITVALTNGSNHVGNAGIMFQASFRIEFAEGSVLLPYPTQPSVESTDQELATIALLYRKSETFAVGHGCAAIWDVSEGSAPTSLAAEAMPTHELPSMTTDISLVKQDGVSSKLKVSMMRLGNGDPDGKTQVEAVIRGYEAWIDQKGREVLTLPEQHRRAGELHVSRCREALERMKAGWHLANTNNLAGRAFQLANEAMASQQLRSRFPMRETIFGNDGTWNFSTPCPTVDLDEDAAFWRPFQIAFVLASLPELVDPDSIDRELVDLIFFPTGGGKTEAYLGAAAVQMFARRLRCSDDDGTSVLMRYTLRLLTAQQFLRASSLICAMESIRLREPIELGDSRFSIGVWLGGETTPNRWAQAVDALRKLQKPEAAPNPFLLRKCPWCGSSMGRSKSKSFRTAHVAGYVAVGKRVLLRCPDRSCLFSARTGLPVHVVDEDIYESRPTLVIGTVDKFAMLAWRPESNSIFGRDSNGQQMVSPPGLIIQDELHLISGPLGSVVGLYESAIEELCTDRREGKSVLPKIVASTATIRSYERQVHSLYGRSRVALFPPHGLEQGSSYFAEPARKPNGELLPGRRYLGVFAPSLGSIQSVQVRVAAATLMAAKSLTSESRDGYWTNLNFFNSLRELGNTVSLLQSDVPDFLNGLPRRDGIGFDEIRFPRNQMELTSRRRTDEIPRAIEELEVTADDPHCIDICLASNIIEVGVDINRLALMTIVGQPKTTAQYIQVSGRVGRNWETSPGLVVTIYGASKPRDRSHFESFQSYHERLYAAVEPTSLTPFALPVLERGLHGAAVALMRQLNPAIEVYPFPRSEFESALDVIERRAHLVDPEEAQMFDEVRRRRVREATNWNRHKWEVSRDASEGGLMRFAGSRRPSDSTSLTWEIATSMRSVDAECRLTITSSYDRDSATEADES